MTSPYLDLPLRTLEQAQLDRALARDAKPKEAEHTAGKRKYLTPEQKELLPVYHDKWIAEAKETEPASPRLDAGENKPSATRSVNRFNTVTQRVDTAYGALYLHAAYGPGGELAGARVSIPGTMHGKELGKVLEDVFTVLNSMLAS